MLTEGQSSYLAKIPENTPADIRPWDREVAEYARNLVKKIKSEVGLEVFWGGSLALEIIGQNDIDLSIFAEPEDFEKYLPKISQLLGKPTYNLDDSVLWRVHKDGHKVDASLMSKTNPGVMRDIFFFNSLKNNPTLLGEYVALKTSGISARDYYISKNEFYNRVTENWR